MKNTEIIKRKGKVLRGVVVSDSMNKSIVVQIDYQKKERHFKKMQKAHKKIMAHDDQNRSKIGNKVIIQESKPWSKRKSFCLVDIVESTEK